MVNFRMQIGKWKLKNLFKSSLRYLIKHPWQFGLSVIGIAMGVAVVVCAEGGGEMSGKFSVSGFGLESDGFRFPVSGFRGREVV